MDVPRATGTESPDVNTDGKPRRDPVRTAGVLLLIACGVDLAIWGILTRWGWEPSALGITETALQALLGAGLIRSGRMWALPTMVFMAVSALIPCIRDALLDVPGHFLWIVLPVPVVIGLLRVGPFLLLLTRHGTRRRHAIAIGLFVFCQVLELAGTGLSIYVGEWMKQR